MTKFARRNAFAGGFLTATTITIVLPTLQVARKLHAITATQSDAFILAAVIVCIVSPIVFNSSFKLLPEDRIKQRVVIMGANTFTVPVMHDLHDNWYSVDMFTDNEENYNTYKSKVQSLSLIKDLSQKSLEKAGAFNGDIFVAANHSDEINLKLAKMAKDSEQMKRVIIRLQQPDMGTVRKLRADGIEVFNFTNVRSSLMRALIESPAVYQIMTDTKNILYSVVVRNPKYIGQELKDWDFIDQITVSRIKRGNKWLAPHGSTVIEAGDEVVFSGQYEAADKIRQILGRK